MNLANPFGQRRGAGLQNIRALDFVDVPIANGAGRVPAWTRADESLVDLHAAPGCKDHLRIELCHDSRIDHPVLRLATRRQLRKEDLSAGGLDQFLNPANPADEWI